MPSNDRVAAVVGASAGIGRATAEALLADGWRVAVMARREHLLHDIANAHVAAGGRAKDVVTHAGDATHRPSVDAFMEGVVARLGRLDALVLNTGWNIKNRALTDLTAEDWHRMIAANLDSAFHGTHSVLPHLRRQGGGLIIYVSSVGALQADASGAAYQAAKHGITGLANAVRVEEQRKGIRASVVFPGLVNTDLVHQRPVVPTEDELRRALQPDDVARCILFVANTPQHVVIPELVLRPALL